MLLNLNSEHLKQLQNKRYFNQKEENTTRNCKFLAMYIKFTKHSRGEFNGSNGLNLN